MLIIFVECDAFSASQSPVDAAFLYQFIRAPILFVSGNWSNFETGSTDTFPSLNVNEACNGKERSGPGLAFLPEGTEQYRCWKTPQTIKHVASRGSSCPLVGRRSFFPPQWIVVGHSSEQ